MSDMRCDTCNNWEPINILRLAGACVWTPTFPHPTWYDHEICDNITRPDDCCECWEEKKTTKRTFLHHEWAPTGWLQPTIEGPVDCNTAEPLRRLLLDIVERQVTGNELIRVLG